MLKKTLIVSIMLAVASTSAAPKQLTDAKFLFDTGCIARVEASILALFFANSMTPSKAFA